MDFVLTIIFTGTAIWFVFSILQKLDKQNRHLKAIRLQLEMQNPILGTGKLLDLDEHINYWHEQMLKHRFNDNKLSDITFKIYWLYVDKYNEYRTILSEVSLSGKPLEIYDKHESWLKDNEEQIRKLEEQAMDLDKKINSKLTKRDLDYEFLGKWDIDQT